MTVQNTYDVIIVGAGIVGLTFACFLGQQGLRIAILEKNKWEAIPSQTQNVLDLRVTAVTRAAENIFSSLDVWKTIVNKGVSAYRMMQVWDQQGKGKIQFNSAELGEPNLGYIIENRVMQEALVDRLKEFENMRIFYGNAISSIEVHSENVSVVSTMGKALSAKLVIAADGARSHLRNLLNLPIVKRDYGQSALVTFIETTQCHQQTAWQCFSSQGILAFLPMRDSQLVSIVWSAPTEQAQHLYHLPTQSFKEALAKASDNCLGEIVACHEQKLIFPIYRQSIKHYVQPRIAFIGDAAHTMHPLAGQGMNLGLLDAASLAEVLKQAQKCNKDIGHLSILRKYERWRKGHNLAMLYAMDIFKDLFSNERSLTIWLRNKALNVVNVVKPAKHFFIKQAMGLMGDLPPTARTQV